MTKKIIKFIAGNNNETFLNTIVPPVKSSLKIPQWYKDMTPYGGHSNNIKDLHPVNDRGSDGSNVSTKLCPPFLDSMLLGYMYCLEDDLLVELDNDGAPILSWQKDIMLVDKRPNVDMAIPEGFYPVQFGIKMNWYYETPKNYSLLSVHPLNRPDLPFYVSSGTVDSDIWGLPFFIPFFIKIGFEGVIKQGTPITQLIPIKRDDWDIKILKDKKTIEKHKIREEKRRTHVTGHYRKTTWQKKNY